MIHESHSCENLKVWSLTHTEANVSYPKISKLVNGQIYHKFNICIRKYCKISRPTLLVLLYRSINILSCYEKIVLFNS